MPPNGIQFSGFCSQGDGASFVGSYKYKTDLKNRLTEYAPEDAKLHSLADRLTVLQTAPYLEHGAFLEAKITRFGSRYVHARAMNLDACVHSPDDDDVIEADSAQSDELLEIMRGLADWIYSQLEAEHNYLTSDAYIDEMLADEEFDEDDAMIHS